MNKLNYTIEDIKNAVSNSYYNRGRAYYNQGKVVHVEIGEKQITGKVKGSRTYTQSINMFGNDIGGVCTCPVRHNCKHVASVLIAALNQKAAKLVVNSITARKQDITPIINYETQAWLENFDKECSKDFGGNKPKSGQKELVFLLKIKNIEASIQPFNRSYKKDGGLSATSKNYDARKISFKQAPAHFTEEDIYVINMMDNLSSYHDFIDDCCIIRSARLLEAIIKTGKCYLQDLDGIIITLGEEKTAIFSWQTGEDGQQMITAVTDNPEDYVVALTPPYYINREQGIFGKITTNIPERIAGALLQSPAIKPNEVEHIKHKLAKYNTELNIPQPKIFTQITAKTEKPRAGLHLHMQIVKDRSDWYHTDIEIVMARVDFIYGDNIVSLDNNNKIITYFDGDKLVNYKRNIAAERILMQQLPNNAEGFPLDYANKYISNLSIPNEYLRNLIAIDGDEFIDEGLMENFWVQFQMEAVPKLRKAGWEITIDENFPYQITVADDEWYTKIDDSSGIDWFGLELGVNIGGKSVNLLPILLEALKHIDADLLASDTPPDVEYLVLPTQQGGEKVALPAARVWEMLRFLKDLYGGNQLESDGTLRMSRLEAANLAELEELSSSLNMRWFGGDKLLKLGNELRNFTGIKQIIPPKSLKAELRDYQKDGLNWMQFLREYQLAGVLADDMGLGKTIQALAYIMYEKEQSRLDKPILVVAPTSVLVNWRMETERFAPTLKTLVLHGSDRKQYFNQISDAELVLTTYPLLYRDKEIWLAQEFHTIILDEAQYIKNSKAKNTQIACQIKADNRICMTGTPIENHLGELWSQFNFLLPGFLGDEKQFRQFFRNPIEKSGDADRNAALARRVKPFMLRRTKQEIATELPPKTVIIRTASLDKAQRDLYEVIRISMQQKVQEEIAKKGLSRSHIVVLEALLRLRQTCCDPRLLKMEAANKVKASAKLEMLMDMVPEMVEEGRNILIFSQFTSMLSLIASELDNHKLKYVKITGQTKDRKTPIEKFQNGKVPIFLISLKAGGTGLNLTAADTVIHYDPWWNPAAENQATDRAYRIGQDKPVFVYKLLTEKTVEEKILEMQEKKASLAAGIFDPKGKAATALTQDDINALFEPL